MNIEYHIAIRQSTITCDMLNYTKYSETSQNRALRIPVLPEYRPNFTVPAKILKFSLQRKSHKTGHP
jgi:hypothetical protein